MTDDVETASSPSQAAQTSSAAADPGSHRSSATSSTPRTTARTSVTSKTSGLSTTDWPSLASTASHLLLVKEGGERLRTSAHRAAERPAHALRRQLGRVRRPGRRQLRGG